MEKFELKDSIRGWTIMSSKASDQNQLILAVHKLGHDLGFHEALASSEIHCEFDEVCRWVSELPRKDGGFIIKETGLEFHLVPDFKNAPQSHLLAIFASVLLTSEQLTEAVSEDQAIRKETAGNFLDAIAIQAGMWPWEPAQAKH